MKTNGPGCNCCTKLFNISKLDKDTGEVIWRRYWPKEQGRYPVTLYECRCLSDGSIIVAGRSVIGHHFMRLDQDATDLIWSKPEYTATGESAGFPQIAIKHGEVDDDGNVSDLIFIGRSALLTCIDADGNKIWESHGDFSNTAFVAYHDGVVYSQWGNYFWAFNATDGTVIYEHKLISFLDPVFGNHLPTNAVLQDVSALGILMTVGYGATRHDLAPIDPSDTFMDETDAVNAGGSWWGCLSPDGYAYMNDYTHAKFYKADPNHGFINAGHGVIHTSLGDTIHNDPGSRCLWVRMLANGNAVGAGFGFWMPKVDNAVDPDPEDYERKNVVCFDPDLNLVWSHKEEEIIDPLTGTIGYYTIKYGLTIDPTDDNPIVTNQPIPS